MLLGFDLSCFGGSFADALGAARRAGGECVLLPSRPDGAALLPTATDSGWPLSLPDCDPEALLWAVGRAGLWLAALRVDGLLLGTPREVEESYRLLRTHAALAMRLGVGVVVHSCAASAGGTTDKADRIEHLAAIADEVVGEYGLRTAAEPLHGTVLATVDDLRYYLELAREPMTGIAINTAHLSLAGQEGWQLWAHWRRIPLVIWNDAAKAAEGAPRLVELGQGVTPLDDWLPGLKELRRQPLSIVHPGGPAGAAPGLAYLRWIRQRAGIERARPEPTLP